MEKTSEGKKEGVIFTTLNLTDSLLTDLEDKISMLSKKLEVVSNPEEFEDKVTEKEHCLESPITERIKTINRKIAYNINIISDTNSRLEL